MSLNRMSVLKDFLKSTEKLIKESKEERKISDFKELIKCLLFLQKILKNVLQKEEIGRSYFL